ncbi:Alkaline phosphatase, tissue-nonspecific isozyme [Folsomia candida]|uniref:alkaline phosphatase n=1 Tax=Folsomia candida TaxID=158441 RepID=A0A226D236_FOLCA|nr:Alkaline phosphatase, tissue-nonspecific isozyme [Folsomia candida]
MKCFGVFLFLGKESKWQILWRHSHCISAIILLLLVGLIGGGDAHIHRPRPRSQMLDNSAEDWMHSFKPNPKERAGSVKSEDSTFWYNHAQNSLRSQKVNMIERVAKNVIFFLGDGMSFATITAARIFKGQLEGSPFGEEAELNFEHFPHIGLSKSFCVDSQVADSACSSTAYMGGTKGNIATAAGKATGIITTTRVTHGKPHQPELMHIRLIEIGKTTRQDYQIMSLKVIMGGGRRELTPSSVMDVENQRPGRREDGKNLIEYWLKGKPPKSSKYVWNRDQLMSINASQVDNVLGLFAHDHMDYVTDAGKCFPCFVKSQGMKSRDLHANADPSLPEMTKVAIDILSKNPNGFVLFVEGGRIDHAHHSTKAQKALVETIALDAAVAAALEMTSEQDTLTIVTADHSHVMTISGYAQRGNPILGFSGISDVDDLPYTTLRGSELFANEWVIILQH